MRVAQYWRMKTQRYRLQGVQYEQGTVCLQAKPERAQMKDTQETLQPVSRQEVDKQKAVTA